MALLVMFMAVGCSIFDNLPTQPNPPIPEPPNPTNSVPMPVTSILQVYETESGYNIPGVLFTQKTGLIVVSYRMDRNPMSSLVYFHAETSAVRVYENVLTRANDAPFEMLETVYSHGDKRSAVQVYKNGAETIGQPFAVGETVYFPAEHMAKNLYWDGSFKNGANSSGKWSVTGFNYNGQPAISYNNNYTGGSMKDNPVISNPLTGTKLFSLPANTMPRSLIFVDGQWLAAGDTGETFRNGAKMSGAKVIHLAALKGNRVYGGGMDGKVYVANGIEWVKLFDTEAGVSMQMTSDAVTSSVLYTGGRQNRLYRISGATGSEKLTLLDKDDTIDNGDNYFGNAVTVSTNGTVYWAHRNAVRNRGIVREIKF